jgi:transposase
MWLHSPDPKFQEKVDEIVALYLDPPPGSTVVCVDEKPGMQALERKHPDKPATPAKSSSCLSPVATTEALQAAAVTCSSSKPTPTREPALAVRVRGCESISREQPGNTPMEAFTPEVEATSTGTAEFKLTDDSGGALSAQQLSSLEPSLIAGQVSGEDRFAQRTDVPAAVEKTDQPTPGAKKGRPRKPCEQRQCCKCGRQGKPGKREFEYIRHGTLTLIGAFLVATGKVFSQVGPTRTGDDLERFMDYLASQINGTVHIIWDNLNIHHGARWIDFNKRHGDRFHFHYTPIHASWVNQIEIWFGIFHRRCLKNGDFTSQEELRRQVEAFLTIWNERDKHPFKWSFAGYGKPKSDAPQMADGLR